MTASRAAEWFKTRTHAAKTIVVVGMCGVLGGLGIGVGSMTGLLFSNAASGTVWDQLAQCESSGNFQNDDTGGNGHFGGFQFSIATWDSVGGTGNPANASPAEQLLRAKILLADAGPGQWACSTTGGGPVPLTQANGAAEGLTILGGANQQAQPSVVAPSVPAAPQAPSPGATAPSGGSSLSAPVAGTTHTVVSGDTLWKLAPGHDWQHMWVVNKAQIGSDPNLIQVGEQLIIPTS